MSDLHVIFKINGSEYALSADDVFQMETYVAPTPVPGAPPHILGLTQVRQQLVPVLDVRTRFGLPSIAPSSESRIVVLAQKGRLVGLLVDSAREVKNIPAEDFKRPPELIAEQSGGYISSVVQLKDRIIMLLDASRVVGQEAVNG